MTFEPSRIDHVEVFVRDREAAVRWYGDVLGLTESRRWDNPGPVMIGIGGTMLAIFQAQADGRNNSDDDSQPPIRWRRVAWRTDRSGFERAQVHLREKGIGFHGPVDHDGPLSIYFNDPDGNPLEITCYPDG